MRFLALFFSLLFLQTSLHATGDAYLFKRYPSKYFVETGTYRGDGLQSALDAGFQELYSIELSPDLYVFTRKRFQDNDRVHLSFGDSGKKLSTVMEKVQGRATIWLDAHFAGEGTVRGRGNCPILDELEQLKDHPIKNHTLLIDDVRLFGTEDFDDITIEQVKVQILKINPNYQFFFEDGYMPNDVLVAVVV